MNESEFKKDLDSEDDTLLHQERAPLSSGENLLGVKERMIFLNYNILF